MAQNILQIFDELDLRLSGELKILVYEELLVRSPNPPNTIAYIELSVLVRDLSL